jgi:hypothetical protein
MNAHWAELIAREHAIELRRDGERTRLGASVSRPHTATRHAGPRLALIGRLVIAFRRGLA